MKNNDYQPRPPFGEWFVKIILIIIGLAIVGRFIESILK